jgi:16S rRNA (uracil1498-N3)-methyltransferase
MPRFYLPPDRWTAPVWELDAGEAHHASRVLRMKVGDTCVVFDGCGRAAHATIAGAPSSSSVLLQPGDDCAQAPNIADITLCQAVPKGTNMDLIIQKAVELGIKRICPILTDHTVVRLNDKEAVAKQQKWQRIALEACKQCGQNTLPVVEKPLPFKTWIADVNEPVFRIIASLAPGARPVRDVLEEARQQRIRHAAILVGPEGDFSPAETDSALEHGFLPITLGPIVLRVETASFFCISAVRYALD